MYAVSRLCSTRCASDKDMAWIFELTPRGRFEPRNPVINLEKEFGRTRVDNTGIDEYWMAGLHAWRRLGRLHRRDLHPLSGRQIPFELIQNEAGKLRYMSGGEAEMPIVFIIEMSGQTPGLPDSTPIMSSTPIMPISRA